MATATQVQRQPTDIVSRASQLRLVQNPINEYDMTVMLNCMYRDPLFYREAREQIEPHFFDEESELKFALAFKVLCDAVDQYRAVDTDVVIALANRELGYLGNSITDDAAYEIIRRDSDGLLWSSINSEVTPATLALARDILRQFLHERTVIFPLRRALNQGMGSGQYAAELNDFLDDVQSQRSRIASCGGSPVFSVGYELGTPVALPAVYHSIGIDFMDEMLGGVCVDGVATGGQREGDVNGIIGVTSGGKTTLACHMAVSAARLCWLDHEQGDAPKKISVIVTAEESYRQLAPRLQSAAFHIPRSTLEKLGSRESYSILSTTGHLKDYERQLTQHDLGNPGQDRLSESERWQANYTWLRDYLGVVDMSGCEEYPDAGDTYISGIVSSLEHAVREKGAEGITHVGIDWVGAICSQYIAAKNMDPSQMHYLLKEFPAECKRRIAVPYNCTVWLFHQIRAAAAAATAASAVKLLTHTDSAECKAIANHMAVCCCIGPPDPTTGCRRMNPSKVRYKRVEDLRPATLKINELFAHMEDVGNIYGIDEAGHKFETLADLRDVGGGEQSSRGSQSSSNGNRTSDSTAEAVMAGLGSSSDFSDVQGAEG